MVASCDFDPEDELARSGVLDRDRNDVRARTVYEQRELATASRSSRQDDGQPANQLSASRLLVEQVCDGESRGGQIEIGWRGKASDNLDCGVFFRLAHARLALPLNSLLEPQNHGLQHWRL